MKDTKEDLVAYLDAKRGHKRKRTGDVSGKAFEALEIATRVLRLHYPWRMIRGTHVYFDNTPIDPFLLPEHSGMEGQFGIARKKYVVLDVYFLFGGAPYASKNETDAFIVEVAFPQDAQRKRWQGITRVRWADLGWSKLGNHSGDTPVATLAGETFVNDFI